MIRDPHSRLARLVRSEIAISSEHTITTAPAVVHSELNDRMIVLNLDMDWYKYKQINIDMNIFGLTFLIQILNIVNDDVFIYNTYLICRWIFRYLLAFLRDGVLPEDRPTLIKVNNIKLRAIYFVMTRFLLV